jgi:hypothetical protein
VGVAEGEATGKSCPWREQASCFGQPLPVIGRSRRNRETVSPDRLRRYQGQCQGPRPLLAPLYSWFTEGFDTTDIQQAQALLYALA